MTTALTREGIESITDWTTGEIEWIDGWTEEETELTGEWTTRVIGSIGGLTEGETASTTGLIGRPSKPGKQVLTALPTALTARVTESIGGWTRKAIELTGEWIGEVIESTGVQTAVEIELTIGWIGKETESTPAWTGVGTAYPTNRITNEVEQVWDKYPSAIEVAESEGCCKQWAIPV